MRCVTVTLPAVRCDRDQQGWLSFLFFFFCRHVLIKEALSHVMFGIHVSGIWKRNYGFVFGAICFADG